MSRTSETPASVSSNASSELRCGGCDKCLAKDGQVKCSRCSTLNALASLPTREQITAQYVVGLALCSTMLQPDKVPLKLTIIPGQGYGGFVQYEPAPPQVETVAELKKQLVMEFGGIAGEQMLDSNPRSLESAFRRAFSRAEQIVNLELPRPADRMSRALELCREALAEAKDILAARRPVVEALAAVLVEKGELSGLEFALIMSEERVGEVGA